MLTRALFALVLMTGLAAFAQFQALAGAGAGQMSLAEADSSAQGQTQGQAKVLAAGITDHEVTQEELEKGAALPVPHFNTPAIAYVLAAGLKKGDVVEIALVNGDAPLLGNTETLAEDQASYLLQAGKRGVPAGGWPEGTYRAEVKITRDGKTLIEQKTTPVAFE
jgi:hypothetical protein